MSCPTQEVPADAPCYEAASLLLAKLLPSKVFGSDKSQLRAVCKAFRSEVNYCVEAVRLDCAAASSTLLALPRLRKLHLQGCSSRPTLEHLQVALAGNATARSNIQMLTLEGLHCYQDVAVAGHSGDKLPPDLDPLFSLLRGVSALDIDVLATPKHYDPALRSLSRLSSLNSLALRLKGVVGGGVCEDDWYQDNVLDCELMRQLTKLPGLTSLTFQFEILWQNADQRTRHDEHLVLDSLDWLSGLQSLRSLAVVGSGHTYLGYGVLPFGGCQVLGALTALTHLQLSMRHEQCKDGHPDEFVNCLAALSQLTGLQQLSLPYCRLRQNDVECLSLLPALTQLTVAGASLHEQQGGRLPRLQELVVVDDQGVRSLAHLLPLPGLRTLALRMLGLRSDDTSDDLDVVMQCIEQVSMSHLMLGPLGLWGLRQLYWDVKMQTLAPLPACVTTLTLAYGAVGDATLRQVAAAAPRLQALVLERSRVHGLQLSSLPAVTELELRLCQLGTSHSAAALLLQAFGSSPGLQRVIMTPECKGCWSDKRMTMEDVGWTRQAVARTLVPGGLTVHESDDQKDGSRLEISRVVSPPPMCLA